MGDRSSQDIQMIVEAFSDWEKRYADDPAKRAWYAMEVLGLCLESGIDVPKWAAEHFIGGWRSFSGLNASSLGEALGIPDHKHLSAKRKRALWLDVGSAVWGLNTQRGVPLKSGRSGPGALEQVAQSFGMSETDVRDLYRSYRDFMRDFEGRQAKGRSPASPDGAENP